MNKKTNCEYCNNYVYDDYYDCYVCDVNLDEDEMGRFLAGSFVNCPYFRNNDEYEVVRQQI